MIYRVKQTTRDNFHFLFTHDLRDHSSEKKRNACVQEDQELKKYKAERKIRYVSKILL